MDAIRDLDRLLASMDPVLSEETYVFLSIAHDEAAERVAQLRPIKRRISLLFSVAVVVLFLLAVVLWIALSMVEAGILT